MTTITLLHGIGGASWRPLLPALAPAPVLDWPLPGYAGSPMLAESSFAAWSGALRDRLEAEDIPRVDLIGHSIGGMLAQDFALRFPERVRALVLYATTPAFGGRDPAFAEAFLRDRLAPLDAGHDMAALAREGIPAMLRPGTAPALVEEATAAMAAVPEAAYRATVRTLTTFNRRDDLQRIAAPTLIIGGEKDPLAPPKTLERMRDAIRGARLVVLPGCGHLAHLEDPAGFNAAVRDFLRGVREG
ncbi:alpha/beta fold hydrolase [Paracraurococcus lichenis]|uniref:Alpha/beta fold hydrolase n=1 Tax=Paracraurococcus lichenis TaxID=3064888 RepID=A0ABT9E681_9PROT|nr:alpha/beta fold hydrolase [Paracraurococcus sp. LOR1-02]MDO9711673.1 alpha/beta fold hydrolase [Paracraurococcus sp. LOR1-02]